MSRYYFKEYKNFAASLRYNFFTVATINCSRG